MVPHLQFMLFWQGKSYATISLLSAKLKDFSIDHLQPMWHAKRARLFLWTPGYIPFGNFMCSTF